jgi:hypothetical protein
MNIREIITTVDRLKPNNYTDADKILWLSLIDARVFSEIFGTHEGAEIDSFDGYTLETDDTTELLIPFPYAEEIYRYWLEAQIDFANQEINKFNNDTAMFNQKWMDYANYYNRTHLPLQTKAKFY